MIKKSLVIIAALLVSPLAAHAGKKEVVSVEINTYRGPASIPLTRKGDGFVGPRGEYYSKFPSKKTLSAVYGAPPSNDSNRGGSAGGDIKVVTVAGGVNIRRNGQLMTRIYTKYPDVRGWKLIRENSEIVVKSGVNREPGMVELFDVRSGKLRDRVRATSIKNGKPSWAKNFAE